MFSNEERNEPHILQNNKLWSEEVLWHTDSQRCRWKQNPGLLMSAIFYYAMKNPPHVS